MNFFTFLEEQKQERFQAFLIHAPARAGKTRFARRACAARPELHYVDVLAWYLSQPEPLPVRQLDSRAFQKLLLDLPCPPEAHTVLVDQTDFLFNTWRPEEKERFLGWLRVTLASPALTNRTFLFIIQTDGALSAANLTNTRGHSRVCALGEFDAI